MSYRTSMPLSLLPLGEGNNFGDFQTHVLSLLDAYMAAWEAGDYSTIRNLAAPFYGLATDAFTRLELKTYLGTIDRELSDEEDAAFSRSMKKLAKNDSEQARATKLEMKAEFEAQNPDGDAVALYESMLDGSHPVFDRAIVMSKMVDAETESLGDEYATLLSFAVAADYLGYLRTSLGAEPYTQLSVQEKDIELISNFAEEVGTLLSDAQNAVYQALKKDHEAPTLLSTVKPYLENLQGKFAIAGAMLGSFLTMVPQVEDTTLKVSAYRAGLDLTRQINHALVWFPYLAYLKANLSDRNYKRWLSYEQRRTDKRTLDSGVAQGAASSIEQLQNGGHTEGDLVQVEGLITAMEIRDDRRPPKFSTFVTLTDLASNQSITLRAHMFGLEDNGVSVGSYLRLNGWVRTGEHWLAEGETGLDIDRVNLGERSRHHWLDNVVERMKGRYPLYKDGMNMFFTLNQ